MKIAAKIQMGRDIQAHGENLLAIFPNAKIKDPLKLCKALRKLEQRAHWIAEDYCNGKITKEELKDGPAWDSEEFTDYWKEKILNSLSAILGYTTVPLKINWDPRGYSLKIHDQYMRDNNLTLYRDWGGYGILAPDFTPT